MEKLLKLVETLIMSITVGLKKIDGLLVEQDYVPCEVELVRKDGRKMNYTILVKNEFVNENKIDIYNEVILKQVLLEYIYNKGNSSIRKQFSDTFNINEIRLLLWYFDYTSNLKQTKYIKCG